MSEGKIENYRQARTAEQYLGYLNERMMDEDICLQDLAKKQYEAEEIILELQRFHMSQKIRLVVDNTKEDQHV